MDTAREERAHRIYGTNQSWRRVALSAVKPRQFIELEPSETRWAAKDPAPSREKNISACPQAAQSTTQGATSNHARACPPRQHPN